MQQPKRVLIVCFHYSQHVRSLLHSFSQFENFQIDLLSSDINTEFLSDTNLTKHKRYCFRTFLKLKVPNMMKFILSWFSLGITFLRLNKYDIIELHYPNLLYLPIHLLYKFKTKKLGVCVWGDDFQHMPGNYRIVFNAFKHTYSYIVTGNESFIHRIQQAFNIPVSKIHLIGFGSIVLQKLKARVNDVSLLREKYGVGNKIVITCGHNAVEAQQHLKIIDALDETDLDAKEIYLIFPMTYPKVEAYINQVKDRLKLCRFEYLMLEEFISDDEIIEYRLISDIFIHIQKTDSFSAAMAEYFYARNIVINGEWLKYPQLQNGHAYFLTCLSDNLTIVIEDAVKNLPAHKAKTNENVDLLWQLKSWESNSKLWYDLFLSNIPHSSY